MRSIPLAISVLNIVLASWIDKYSHVNMGAVFSSLAPIAAQDSEVLAKSCVGFGAINPPSTGALLVGFPSAISSAPPAVSSKGTSSTESLLSTLISQAKYL
jgi:hypothetical protein